MKAAKCLLVLFGTFIAAVFIIPLFLHCTVNIGTVTGIAIGGLLILLGIFLRQVGELLGKLTKKRVGKIVVCIVGFFVLAVCATASVETALMIRAATKAPEKEATVVVLGCRVYDGKPSNMLRGRLDAAYDYMTEHESAVCIVCGGKGQNESMTEAECMYNYLVGKGIAPNRIIMEDKSRTTRENLQNAQALIKKYELSENIAIVTSEFHEYRAGLIAKDLGLSYGSIPSKTSGILLPTYYVRELYGILYQWAGIGE